MVNTARFTSDPHVTVTHQERVNTEMFKAIEILGRKLEKSESERDLLARRLALIESAATVDEKTGRLYLPIVADPAAQQPIPPVGTPRWMAAASLMSSALAIFAVALVAFRAPQPPGLTSDQVAVLNALTGTRVAGFEDAKPWKSVVREEIKSATAADPAGGENDISVPFMDPLVIVSSSEEPMPDMPAGMQPQEAPPTDMTLVMMPEAAPEEAKIEPAAGVPEDSVKAEEKEEVAVVVEEEAPEPEIVSAKKASDPVMLTSPAKEPEPVAAPVKSIMEVHIPGEDKEIAALAKKVKKPEVQAEKEQKPGTAIGKQAIEQVFVGPPLPKGDAEPVAREIVVQPEVVQKDVIVATAPAETEAVKTQKKKETSSGAVNSDPELPAKLAEIEKRAFSGVPEAQHDLATMYAAGKVVAQDYKRAVYWFSKAADGGIANANYNLGVMFQQGLGVKQDPVKATRWYERAAQLGHPEAMYNLGISFVEGIGVAKNIDKGVSWFMRASDAGVAQAAFNLGVLYESNFIGPIDIGSAVEWYQKALKMGHAEAAIAVDRLQGQMAAGSDQALTLADMVEPAAGDSSAILWNDMGSSPEEEGSPVATMDIIVKVQEFLSRQGFLPGKPTGTMSPQTEDAIRAWQKKAGLPEDGLPSQELLDKMTSTAPVTGKKKKS